MQFILGGFRQLVELMVLVRINFQAITDHSYTIKDNND